MARCLIVFLFAARLFGQTAEGDARVQALYTQAKAAQASGDIAGAAAKYEEILRIAPRLGPAYNNLGALYFRQREYGKAAAVLERGLKADPSMSSAAALLGISLYESGEYARARPRLEASLRANPADANVQMFLVKDLSKLGDYGAAATHLQQMGAKTPKNQEIWYLLAKVYMKLSEQALARMNSIDPNSVLAHELSAEMMESMNNYEGAVVELKHAIEMAPQRPGTHYKLGEAYSSLSKWASAGEQYRAELAVDPGNCLAQWKLGSIALQQNGGAAEALAMIDKSLGMCPGITEARVDRARALMKLDRNEEAVKDLETAAKANPTEPSTHFLLARAYRASGRAAESQSEMRIFSKLDEAARAATAQRAEEVIQDKETAH
jgi:tetratricopeptide (TPR) repeat protein